MWRCEGRVRSRCAGVHADCGRRPLRPMKPSRTVCGVEKSGVHDVYQRQGARYTCTEEKTTTKTAVGEEVKPIHTMAITGLCEV